MEVQRRCGGLIYASARKLHLLRTAGLDMAAFTRDESVARYRVSGMADAGFVKLQAMSEDPAMKAKHDAVCARVCLLLFVVITELFHQFIGVAPSGWEWERVTKKHAHERPYTYRNWQTVHCYGVYCVKLIFQLLKLTLFTCIRLPLFRAFVV